MHVKLIALDLQPHHHQDTRHGKATLTSLHPWQRHSQACAVQDRRTWDLEGHPVEPLPLMLQCPGVAATVVAAHNTRMSMEEGLGSEGHIHLTGA